MTSFSSSLAFIWYVHIKNSKTNGWVIPWYLPENWLKIFFWRKWYLMSGHGVILDDPGQLELDTIIEIWRSLEGFSWVANLMAAMAKLYFPEWPRPTSTRWTRGGPPPWLSPWRAWDQNKSCLAWWADHFDVFFDRVQPPPSGHGVGLLCGYHPGGLGTKTKDA